MGDGISFDNLNDEQKWAIINEIKRMNDLRERELDLADHQDSVATLKYIWDEVSSMDTETAKRFINVMEKVLDIYDVDVIKSAIKLDN